LKAASLAGRRFFNAPPAFDVQNYSSQAINLSSKIIRQLTIAKNISYSNNLTIRIRKN
jgi:hypothetical protein